MLAAKSYFYPDGTVRHKPWYMSMHKWKTDTSTNTNDITIITTLDSIVASWYSTLGSYFLQPIDAIADDPIFRCNDTDSGGIALRKLLSVNPRVLNDAKERADLIDLFLSDSDTDGRLYQKPVLPHILDLATTITTTFPFDFVCRLITMHFRSLETYESPSAHILRDPEIYGITTDWPTVHYECPYMWVLLILRQHAPDTIMA